MNVDGRLYNKAYVDKTNFKNISINYYKSL